MSQLSAIRRLVEHIYRALSKRQEFVVKTLANELAKTGFKVERISSSTLLWQVAYGIALKLILYNMIRQRFNLPSLSELRVSELEGALKEAYKVSGLYAMRPSWIDIGYSTIEVTTGMRDVLQEVIKSLEMYTEGDALGRLYEELMPQEERRRLGEFYTPRSIAEFMVKWAVRKPGDFVLDPCVGSGTFLIEALYRFVSLSCDSQKAFSQIYGIDINPLATLMATINILRHVPNAQPRIFLGDFLKLNPLTISMNIDRTTFEAIVCNPPYTRHHELLPSYKEEIANMIETRTGERVSRLSSIYTYFFLHAYNFLKEGGRLAFITPSEWMEADYGITIRRFLAKKMSVEAIILFGEKSLAFPGILTRACITLATKERERRRTILIKLRSWPPVSELIEAVERGGERSYEWGLVKSCDLTVMDPTAKWTPLFNELAAKAVPPFITKLGALAKVSRGIATGANEFFTLSELEVKSYGVELEYLKPVIASARYLVGYDFTKTDWELLKKKGRKAYLLWCFKRKDELRGTSVLKYIEMGEKKGFHKRYLTSHRPVWYWVEKRDPPDAFLFYMFRKGLRFVYNEARSLALNTIHCVYINEEVKREETNVKALLAFLNSHPAFELADKMLRVYGGGMYKLEPKEAENIPCINPLLISASNRESLAELFDELCLAAKRDKVEEEEVYEALNFEVRRLLSS